MGENNIQGLKNPRDPKKNLQERSLEFFFFYYSAKSKPHLAVWC